MSVPRRIVVALVIQSLLMATIPLPVFAFEPPGGPVRGAAPVPAEVEEWIGSVWAVPDRKAVLNLGRLRMEIPAGAVSESVEITVRELGATERLSAGMTNVTSAAGYRFEPHGMRFRRGVRVTVPFDPAILESEAALSNLFTYFYNDRAGRWERLQRLAIDREQATVVSLTDHFTDMINATLQLPEGP